MRNSDARRSHCILPIHNFPDGRQIPPIVENETVGPQFEGIWLSSCHG